MLIWAGNPVLSTPGGARLEEALATLEWCVAIDMYVTETSRHADVILPPVSSLEREMAKPMDRDQLLLIGRRELRSNNSWMHNVPGLVSGRERCVLFVNPEDAKRRGLTDGKTAMLASAVHRDEVRIEVTDEMMPGVVRLPHGWGHKSSAEWQRVAGARPGVSANDWTDDGVFEPVVGQSILNGVPVTLEPVGARTSAKSATADAVA
jgi:anaerobic selenocysteine-containing dehydrogenase